MSERRQAVVITRNGRTTVLTGWRASLAWIGVAIAAGLILGLLLLLFIGAAVTFAAAVLLGVPLAVAIAFLWSRWNLHGKR